MLSTFHRPENVDDDDRLRGDPRRARGRSRCRSCCRSTPAPRAAPLRAPASARWGPIRVVEPRRLPRVPRARRRVRVPGLGLGRRAGGGERREAARARRARASTERPEVLGTFAELVTDRPGDRRARGRDVDGRPRRDPRPPRRPRRPRTATVTRGVRTAAAIADARGLTGAARPVAVRLSRGRRYHLGPSQRSGPTPPPAPATRRRATGPIDPIRELRSARARSRTVLHLRDARRGARRRRRGLRVPHVTRQLPDRALRPLRCRVPRPAPDALRSCTASTRTTTTRSTSARRASGSSTRCAAGSRRVGCSRPRPAAPRRRRDPRRRLRRRLPPRPAAGVRPARLAARGRRPGRARRRRGRGPRACSCTAGRSRSSTSSPTATTSRSSSRPSSTSSDPGRGAACDPPGAAARRTPAARHRQHRLARLLDREAPPLGRLSLPPALVPVRRAVAAPARGAHRLRGRRARHDGQPGELGVLDAQRARRLGRAASRGRLAVARVARPARRVHGVRLAPPARGSRALLRAVLRRAPDSPGVCDRAGDHDRTRRGPRRWDRRPRRRPASCCATASTWSCYEAGPTRSEAWPTAIVDAEGFTFDTGAHFITNRLATAIGVDEQCRTSSTTARRCGSHGRSYDYPSGLLTRPPLRRVRARRARRSDRRGPARLRGRAVPPRVRCRARRRDRARRSSRRGRARRRASCRPRWPTRSRAGSRRRSGLTLAAKLTHRAVAIGYCARGPPERQRLARLPRARDLDGLRAAWRREVADSIRLEQPGRVHHASAAAVRSACGSPGRQVPAAAVISTAPINVLPRLVEGTDALEPFRALPVPADGVREPAASRAAT